MALEQAKCKANETIMIGDRLDNDIVPQAIGYENNLGASRFRQISKR